MRVKKWNTAVFSAAGWETRGLILEAETDKKVPVARDKLLKSPDGQPLDRSRYADEASFKKDVFAALDTYLSNAQKPNVFVLPFNHGDMKNAPDDADALAKTVKEYYGEKNRRSGNDRFPAVHRQI